MREAAEILNFERAADLRDRINELRGQLDKGQLESKGYSIFQTASTPMFEKHAILKKLRAQTNTFPWYNFRKKGFLI